MRPEHAKCGLLRPHVPSEHGPLVFTIIHSMILGFLCVSYINALFFLITIAKPLGVHPNSSLKINSERTWLWGWTWGSESTVSVVDRSPVVSFSSRPGTSYYEFC